jgi:hypothetical protein
LFEASLPLLVLLHLFGLEVLSFFLDGRELGVDSAGLA